MDEFIARGRFPNRTAALRSALRALIQSEREREQVEQYQAAYTSMPQDESEFGLSDAAFAKWIETTPEDVDL